MRDVKDLTFRTIDRTSKEIIKEPLSGEYPLENWYVSVYDKPLGSFSKGDLARSLRQNFFSEYIVFLCLQILSEDFFAGEYYEGELFYALRSLPDSYWRKHIEDKEQFLSIAYNADQHIDDEDLQQDLTDFLKKLVAIHGQQTTLLK